MRGNRARQLIFPRGMAVILVMLTVAACSAAQPTILARDFISTQVKATVQARAMADVEKSRQARLTQEARPTATPTPAATNTPLPSLTVASASSSTARLTNPQPTFIYVPSQQEVTSAPSKLCLHATLIADVTIPAGTILKPGEPFTKIWEFKNTGTCGWNTQFDVFFVSGDQLSAPGVVDFPNDVPPGSLIRISIEMKAPDSAGSYIGYWDFANQDGIRFGVGSDGKGDFMVSIVVK